ncbi:dTDP-4-dehydrorhamnose reductase [Pirellulimonas nuda]|uniref:dTDP-4-dehydrorhamnose reductase n=1 Tax=Pirellulimonas nuda TaxID=2528009 RepID=A0A518DJR8_9BACT|nr:NAD-dependent epimerase/dehydratase family protein [Pirellulimonas nuda]QDU91720.1 dTDP-4-dehydrorhamnose reductase [Pirellulimonas nuda]
MQQVLVTGASGFIGQRLVERLRSDGHDVACLVRRRSRTQRLEALGARLISGDVTRPESLPAALEGVQRVIHLAGLTHARTLADFLAVNEAGAGALAEACARQASPPVLLMVSSLAAAGPSPEGAAHREADPCRPVSQYGKSKLAGEQAVRRWAGETPITILRPPVVFGPGDRDGLTLFLAVRRFPIHLVPNLKGLPLSLVYVDDLVDAMVRAVDQGERLTAMDGSAGQGVYYAADPAVSSYAEMGRLASAAQGRRVLVICRRKYPFLIPALAGDAVSWLTGKPTLFSMDKLREASATGWVCSSQKAAEQLGFAAPIPLVERYQQTAEWYRAEGWI